MNNINKNKINNNNNDSNMHIKNNIYNKIFKHEKKLL